MGDRFLVLLKREQKAIRQSRLGYFDDEIFAKINPDDFMALYRESGRGLAYLQGLIGVYLLMVLLKLTGRRNPFAY